MIFSSGRIHSLVPSCTLGLCAIQWTYPLGKSLLPLRQRSPTSQKVPTAMGPDRIICRRGTFQGNPDFTQDTNPWRHLVERCMPALLPGILSNAIPEWLWKTYPHTRRLEKSQFGNYQLRMSDRGTSQQKQIKKELPIKEKPIIGSFSIYFILVCYIFTIFVGTLSNHYEI